MHCLLLALNQTILSLLKTFYKSWPFIALMQDAFLQVSGSILTIKLIDPNEVQLYNLQRQLDLNLCLSSRVANQTLQQGLH